MPSGVRPLVSVITPSHDPRFLGDAWESLRRQSYDNWEWLVLLNAGAEWSAPDDKRVVIESVPLVNGVGHAKRIAASRAVGHIIVELDHDDVLFPEALERIVSAFADNPDASLVYSDCVGIDASGCLIDVRYSESLGWRHAEFARGGRTVTYPLTFEPTPHNVSLIWFAPNHVRAFQRRAYEQVGGYDASLRVLDDQELMARLYRWGPFVQLAEPLYFQRMHDGNTQRDPALNAEIQRRTVELFEWEIEPNALAWARRSELLALDFGAAHAKPDGYLGVDQYPGPGVDIVAELPAKLPLPDNSVGVIRACDFLEHVADKVAVMNEIHRLLAPGGILISRTPSTDGRGAFQDPTHVAFYNENSFWYLTDEQYCRYVPTLTARFQASRVRTYFPTLWHEQVNISYVEAILIALKPSAPINGGPVLVSGFRPEDRDDPRDATHTDAAFAQRLPTL
ncbi:MAG TPA: methyltransferase domain-containing protein [Microbacteriaceae bacterium]|nr:methyltransferase domain-containing protein [Microbacteriaceae bacterium]